MRKLALIIVLALFVIPFKGQAIDIVDGDLIRAENGIDVYIVKLIGDKKFKRLILNPQIFNQYGHLTWEMIKDVSPAKRDEYTVSDLVRAVEDEKIYKLYLNGDTGEKRWIKTADDFLDLGYDWEAVYEINSFERDFYVPGEDLVAVSAPEPPLEPSDEGQTGQAEEPTRDPITINVPDDYSTIQGAIDSAIDGDTISVNAATYNENIVINKNIKLIGGYAVSAIIDGQGNGPGISITNADDFLIQRFTIKSQDNKGIYCSGINLSKGEIKNVIFTESSWGIYADGNCDLAILNNIFYENRNSANNDGAGILIKNNFSYGIIPEIINNTIDDNFNGIWSENADLKAMNNIITNSFGGGNSTGIYHSGDGISDNIYNDVWQNGFNYNGDAGVGNGSLVVNPRFFQVSQRNYTLKTDPSDLSPCIDRGSADFIYNDGMLLSGNFNYRNDMGAYGGPDNKAWTP